MACRYIFAGTPLSVDGVCSQATTIKSTSGNMIWSFLSILPRWTLIFLEFLETEAYPSAAFYANWYGDLEWYAENEQVQNRKKI
jgi:hypothetical protein